MARPEAPQPQQGGDDLDALFEVDHDMDDMFSAIRREKEADASNSNKTDTVPYQSRKKADAASDDEIKITKKKRAPIAKLDDTRLLSEKGIPTLQKLSRTQFKKFKGKGHEFSDVGRMLRMYQLWLDDLYPRAKFADGLAMIEKVGHGRRMVMQRRAWVEEGKPKDSVEDGGDVAPEEDEAAVGAMQQHGGDIVEQVGDDSDGDDIDPFDLDFGRPKVGEGGTEGKKDDNAEKQDGNEPDEDELDALLAAEEFPAQQQTSIPSRPAATQRQPPAEPSFDDDEEAMRDMDDLW